MKALVIGGGSIGKRHTQNILSEFKDANVSIITKYSTRKDNLFCNERVILKNKIDSSEIFNLVYVASPASMHQKHLNSVNENCKKILIEKPLYSAFDEKNFLLKKNNWEKIFIGYILRFDPIIYKTKEIIKSGNLGDLYYGRVWAGQFLPDWRPSINYRKTVSAQKKLGGGPLHELSHEIDYITYLLGETPVSVLCDLQKLTDLDIDTEDYCSLKLKFNKAQINLDLDFIANPAKLGFCLYFKNGIIEANFVSRKLELTLNNSFENIDVTIPSFNSLYVNQLHTLNNTANYEKIKLVEPASLNDANKTMNIIKAAIESDKFSEWIKV